MILALARCGDFTSCPETRQKLTRFNDVRAATGHSRELKQPLAQEMSIAETTQV